MKCDYCKIDIHPVNLTYKNNKPYHYICADFVNLKTVDKPVNKLFMILQYTILGLVIIGGTIAISRAFRLGLYLGRLVWRK